MNSQREGRCQITHGHIYDSCLFGIHHGTRLQTGGKRRVNLTESAGLSDRSDEDLSGLRRLAFIASWGGAFIRRVYGHAEVFWVISSHPNSGEAFEWNLALSSVTSKRSSWRERRGSQRTENAHMETWFWIPGRPSPPQSCRINGTLRSAWSVCGGRFGGVCVIHA